MYRFDGVMPPMITPFKENGDVDYDAFTSNILKWNNDRMIGYLVLGSNSETAYLSEEEKLELVRLTVETTTDDRHVMVGSGMESACETIRFTNKCAKLGAKTALILTPFYYGNVMNSKALIRYFTTVADASDIPVLMYNVTKFTHVNISADAIEQLSRHNNIIGMKDSNGDVPQLATFLRVADPSFQIMTGTFGAWYPALALGITGIVSAMANCCPNQIAEVQRLFLEGKHEKSKDLYQKFFPVNAAVTGAFGIPGLKYASDLLGYRGGRVRNPLIDLNNDGKEKLKKIVEEALA